jgi:hypothetical protein
LTDPFNCINPNRTLPAICSSSGNLWNARHFTVQSDKETAMDRTQFSSALIVGAGSGLSASVARLFKQHGMKIALAARNIAKLNPLQDGTGAAAFTCDATDRPDAIAASYLHVLMQPRSAWTWEVELRPWVERF